MKFRKALPKMPQNLPSNRAFTFKLKINNNNQFDNY